MMIDDCEWVQKIKNELFLYCSIKSNLIISGEKPMAEWADRIKFQNMNTRGILILQYMYKPIKNIHKKYFELNLSVHSTKIIDGIAMPYNYNNMVIFNIFIKKDCGDIYRVDCVYPERCQWRPKEIEEYIIKSLKMNDDDIERLYRDFKFLNISLV